ncbi:MAG: BamA/TamA family outer membrane protein [Gammaproteobacteria bacterium]|nr:BamA/TamA family outer membrane protein [Gammaproteobacteria bacterium]
MRNTSRSLNLHINSLLLTSLLVCGPSAVTAGAFFGKFIDPVNGKFDVSQWLAGRSGFLPIPLIISDPAVGYGGGLAVAFLHDPKDEESKAEDDPNAMLHLPPSVSFVAGAYTENDSWLLGGGHIASWKKDTIRYTGIVGYGDFNLRFYGVESSITPREVGLNFNIQGFFLMQELIFRVKKSNFFVGGRYSFLSSDVKFKLQDQVPGVSDDQFDSSTGGLGLIVKYDSRDNIMSPSSGHYAKFEPVFYNRAFGGDFNYTKTKLSNYSYWPVSDVVLGLRLEGDFTSGDVPFYDAPYIEMRGVPALRHQGEDVVVAEVEARWDIDPRWSLVGFIGSGWAADSVSNIDNNDSIIAGGGGFRYLVARRYGMRMGLDIARGPDDTVIYLAVGSSWN